MNYEKTHTSHFEETYSCMETMIDRKWKDAKEAGATLSFQSRGLQVKLEKRMEVAEKKKSDKDANKESLGALDDGEMIFARKSGSVIMTSRDMFRKLMDGLGC